MGGFSAETGYGEIAFIGVGSRDLVMYMQDCGY